VALSSGVTAYVVAPSPAEPIVQEVVANHVRSLMADHLTDVASTDQHTVKPWFAGKLDFSPPVVDLAAQNFPLVGGRLEYVGGHTVAALVYGRREHRINVFIWPDSSTAGASTPTLDTRRGFQIVTWSMPAMRAAAVSDLNGAELRELADLIERAATSNATPSVRSP
jgi:anti-sigma factor RsiW